VTKTSGRFTLLLRVHCRLPGHLDVDLTVTLWLSPESFDRPARCRGVTRTSVWYTLYRERRAFPPSGGQSANFRDNRSPSSAPNDDLIGNKAAASARRVDAVEARLLFTVSTFWCQLFGRCVPTSRKERKELGGEQGSGKPILPSLVSPLS